ncbi:MAG: molecular chaperone DnaJ [Actinomycetota bacterium]|nr:molecular chaperone DnaJ [Actinomycetota bacterium]
MAGTDYYELLEVQRDAGDDEIKRAYRRLARELHPDTNPDPAATERFKEITVAYETLRDPEKRAHYDRFGADARGMGGQAGDPFANFGQGGLGDIFEAFFGGGATRTRGPAGPPRGGDMELVLDLAFEQAVFGVQREVELRVPVPCETCGGSGARPGTSPTTCSGCGGAGEVRRVRQSILGQMVTASVCPTCGGSGEEVSTPCTECRGEGRRTDEKTYLVDVPAGVDDGTTLRLTGRGAAGPRGGPAGDLYVHLRVKPHDRFQRVGHDLLHVLPLPMTQAALGAHLPFATLDGDEDLVVPAGTQSGREFRLRGRGVPLLNGRGRGDLVVRVTVETPTSLSTQQEELLRQLAEERGEQVATGGTGFFNKIKSAFK